MVIISCFFLTVSIIVALVQMRYMMILYNFLRRNAYRLWVHYFNYEYSFNGSDLNIRRQITMFNTLYQHQWVPVVCHHHQDIPPTPHQCQVKLLLRFLQNNNLLIARVRRRRHQRGVVLSYRHRFWQLPMWVLKIFWSFMKSVSTTIH